MPNVNLVPLNQTSLLTEVMSREILKSSLSMSTRGYSVHIVKSSFRYNFRTVIFYVQLNRRILSRQNVYPEVLK